MEITKRHHYIPKFFIKGFSGEDGLLAVFNKENGKLDNLRKSPKQIFFEWNRNTFNINGEENDFLEKLYQFGESKFSKTYRSIIEREEEKELSLYELFHLMYFISEIHWRVPNQDKEFINYIKQLTPEKLSLKFGKIENGKTSQENFENFINEPALIESIKIIRAMENFESIKKDEILKKWKLYYTPQNNPQLNLLSDNPVIIRDYTNSNILNNELIFPLSKGKTIYLTNGKALNEIPPENKIDVDVLAFIQSYKIVCGPNSKYLEDISELAKFYNTEQRIHDLKEKVFSIFN